MHSFQEKDIALPAGYDVIVSFPPGGAARTCFMTDSAGATMTS